MKTAIYRCRDQLAAKQRAPNSDVAQGSSDIPTSIKSTAALPGVSGALGVCVNGQDKVVLNRTGKKESNVRVIARFRPPPNDLDEEEAAEALAFCVWPDQRTVESFDRAQRFELDFAFDERCTQAAVYDVAGRPMIDDVLDGYNGTIFAYGQTGSGKTHCMFGPHHEVPWQSDDRGVVPRAAQHVFDRIRAGADDVEFVLRCSLFEIYREQLRDLMDPSNISLRVKETPQRGIFVDGLTQEFVTCESDILDILHVGSRMRAMATTQLNQHSSRSHVIFSLACEQRMPDGTEKTGKLNLVDLAGSEKVWKSSSWGVTLEEAKKINWSLSALGNVINALAEKRPHVPYRDSKLTRILQDTLGGNFKTALVVTCSTLSSHLDETLSSLYFASRAKAVCNHVKINFVCSAQNLMVLVDQLQHDLLQARSEVVRLRGGPPPGPPAAASLPGEGPEGPQGDEDVLMQEQWMLPPRSVPRVFSESTLNSSLVLSSGKWTELAVSAKKTAAVFKGALVAQEELLCEILGRHQAHQREPLVRQEAHQRGPLVRQEVGEWELCRMRVANLKRALQLQTLSWQGIRGRQHERQRELDLELDMVYASSLRTREAGAAAQLQTTLVALPQSPGCMPSESVCGSPSACRSLVMPLIFGPPSALSPPAHGVSIARRRSGPPPFSLSPCATSPMERVREERTRACTGGISSCENSTSSVTPGSAPSTGCRRLDATPVSAVIRGDGEPGAQSVELESPIMGCSVRSARSARSARSCSAYGGGTGCTRDRSERLVPDSAPEKDSPLKASLQHKAAMLRLDIERERAMSQMRLEQQQSEFQQWITATMGSVRHLEQSQRESLGIKRCLQDQLATRHSELASVVAENERRRLEVRSREFQLEVGNRLTELNEADHTASGDGVKPWVWSICAQVSDAMIVLEDCFQGGLRTKQPAAIMKFPLCSEDVGRPSWATTT